MDNILFELNVTSTVSITVDLALKVMQLEALGKQFAVTDDPFLKESFKVASDLIFEDMAMMVKEVNMLLSEINYTDPAVQIRLDQEASAKAKELNLEPYFASILPVCQLGGIV